MRITAIVNSYNYERFIPQALDSVLTQTVLPDEIIVVDDGSDDGSCSVIERYVHRHPERIKLVRKTNGGQLSAFNEAARHVTGDIIFFLDSDDAWLPTYVEKIVAIYQSQPVDFVYCSLQNFDAEQGVRRAFPRSVDLGFTAALTYYMKVFVGAQTASLSIRKHYFDKIYPAPFEKDWIQSADFSLVAGASLAGARKYYCSEALVLYRMHPINAHKIAKAKKEYHYKLIYHRNAMIEHYMERFCLTEAALSRLIEREITTRNDAMNTRFFLRYLRVIYLAERNLFWKIFMTGKLVMTQLRLVFVPTRKQA